MEKFIYKELIVNINYITKYYKTLISEIKKKKSVGSINEWIIDNYYLISEQKTMLKKELFSKNYRKIKFKRKYQLKKLIENFIKENNYKLDTTLFFNDINEYQTNNKDFLTFNEIEFVNTLIRVTTINKLKKIVMSQNKKFELKKEIDLKFKQIIDNDFKNIDEILNINEDIINNPFFIEELNSKLGRLGEHSQEVFEKLNKILKDNKLGLKDIIKRENDILTLENLQMVNLFDCLKKSSRYKTEFLFYNISFSEKILNKEKAKIYENMYESSKSEYRTEIKKQLKKSKLNEYDFVKELVKKADDNNKHLGIFLFKKQNTDLRTKVYILSVVSVTVLISLLLSLNFGKISFFLFLIPICGLVIDIVTEILIKTVQSKSLFRLKFENELPKEYSTMIVVPTIVKNKKKIDDMFDNLEVFYLSNRTNNLYFALLGDAASEKTKDAPYDDEIVKYGMEKIKYLNEKYKKDMFHFVYRTRVYHKGEDAYLGYERKRGALTHFNKLLLNRLTEKQKKEYFKCHSFKNFNKKIKYVITLDADTEVLLNTALKLIGTMAHPMNKAVVKDNKVVSGYALMQPRITVDVKVTNESEYSQLFAGLGGLDIYTVKSFDLYQDVFNEGSFVGKGIYDLEIFDDVLSDAFPENLILSHDLIEGNYIKCGFINDIELFDSYPSKYLNDAFRHHRWTRGDWQISGYLKKKVKNLKNKIVDNQSSLIGKWKIFDNLRRSLRMPSLIALLFYGFMNKNVNPENILLVILVIIGTPILFYLINQILSRQKYDPFLKYYLNLIRGFISVILKTVVVISLLPYETYLYLDAIIKVFYRMLFSKKNLLNWITAEESEKLLNNKLKTYLKAFVPNYLFSIVLMGIAYFFKPDFLYLAISISIIWLLSPILMYLLGKPISDNRKKLNFKAENEVKEIAFRTWKYFDDLIVKETNYLIPDNYQENRKVKPDYRTSPTDIGFSIVSIINALELEFIKEDEAIEKLTKIINSVEKLPKWNGHLFNWYNIYSMREILPNFISTADSGNFVVALFVLRGFLHKKKEYNVLLYKVNKLIDSTDFSKLYNFDLDVFSVGYNLKDQELLKFHYNNFLSESRIASFIAIAKNDVPFKHWFSLDKTLTKYKYQKGIVSWSGTSFEYFMPLLFMKSFEHTLLDETYDFAHFVQKDFIKQISHKLPWGIGESGYNELDDSQNYKYKAFGIPQLKFHDNEMPEIVISPYSSMMAIDKFPKDVYRNIKKLKKLDLYNNYGFYEAYDSEDKSIVKSYYAHHQGMLLAGITNYFTNNSLQEHFHHNKTVRAVSLLLKEKVQIRPHIDLKISKYKKHNYQRTPLVNDIREITKLNPIPEVGILSNGFYSIFLNDRGVGFSKYKNLHMNRYRKITDQKYGMFFYIRKNNNKTFFTNTQCPGLKKPDIYNVVFASDRIKYLRTDDDIITTTEITVTKDHNAEIRKLTFENISNKEVSLEVISYLEVILSRIEEDVAHRTFNSLTISSDIDKDTNSLIFKRKSRTKNYTEYFMVNRFFEENDSSDFEFETSRLNFVGRNNDLTNPDVIVNQKKLSSNHLDLIDPISSIKKTIKIKPNSKKELYFLVGFGKSKEQIMEIVYAYNSKIKIVNAFEESTILNNTRNAYAGLSGNQLSLYNKMLKYIYQTLSYDDSRKEILKNEDLNKGSLWKYGISGTLPLITVRITDVNNINTIKEILQAYEFYKSRTTYIDIAIINEVADDKKHIVNKYVDDMLFRINNLNYFENSPGSVYKISNIDELDLSVFKTYSRIYLEGDQTFLNQILGLEDMLSLEENEKLTEIEVKKDNIKPEFFNEYGGFINDGSEYCIVNKDTPMPWINVLTNENFGSIVTSNLSGFTFLYNSREFKFTSWSNDIVSDPQSEIFLINGKKVVPSSSIYGLGYSIFKVITNDYELNITVFVPIKDNVKVYKIDVIKSSIKNLKLEFLIKPVLGTSEEDTNRHILSYYDESSNSVVFSNSYNAPFKKEKMFVSSNLKIKEYDSSNVVFKSIKMNLKHESVVMIGSVHNLEHIVKKYSDISEVNNELENTKLYWKSKNKISVKTPDKSFNYMINHWYLYQIFASRLYSKVGFYQVGGAIGFRDQLQDCLALLHNDSKYVRNQILNHAKHQYIEGDVLHWWHEDLKFGAKTKFSDDYLWLIFVTYEYLKNTNDYSILDEMIEFVESDYLSEMESEKGVNYSYSLRKEPLSFHLKLCVEKSLRQYGKHGLPLMGSGDWNDGMNKVGEKGKGESVWVGFFFYDCLLKMMEIFKDDKEYIKVCDVESKKLKSNINEYGFDGKWYLRAFYDNKAKLGSIENTECQIDLICQAWSILTEVVDESKIPILIEEVENRLIDKDHKIIKLLTPSFENPKNNPGYISYYIRGVRENGGQYTHAAFWYILALLKLGEVDRAYEYYSMINPVNRTLNKKSANKYKIEPYVIAGDIYSNETNVGRGGWSWYTGSASWAYKVAIEDILGLKKEGNILKISPKMPFDSVEIKYTYEDTIYNIIIKKSNKNEILVDNKGVEFIELINDKEVHNIEVFIGG